jgi:RNA polymerase sigma factor (sigma-70 family)
MQGGKPCTNKRNQGANMENHHQLLLANMDSIEAGVRRAGSRVRLSEVDVQDLISDAVAKLLEGGLSTFDPNKGSASTFFRTVAWRVTADAMRAMGRGGQFSGYLGGIGNTVMQGGNDRDDGMGDVQRAPARSTHAEPLGAAPAKQGLAVKVRGEAIERGVSIEDAVAERQWTEQARDAVAEVLPSLSDTERALYALLASGEFDAATYAAEQGISTATAHVRANRLRAKLREKLAA